MTHSLGTTWARGEKYSYPIGRVMRLVGAAYRTPQVSRPESPGTKGTWKEKKVASSEGRGLRCPASQSSEKPLRCLCPDVTTSATRASRAQMLGALS